MAIPAVVSLLVGLSLLIFGRKLFWLVGAAIGFLVGMSVARHFFDGSPETLYLIVAIGAGLLGALLALFLQRVTIWIAGFLAGGFFLVNLIEKFGVDTVQFPWVAFLIGGVIGGILVAMLFDWALILVSSLTGAFLVTHALDLGKAGGSLLVLLLFVGGIMIQARLKKGKKMEGEQRKAVETKADEKS
jgi:hypothetical protein